MFPSWGPEPPTSLTSGFCRRSDDIHYLTASRVRKKDINMYYVCSWFEKGPKGLVSKYSDTKVTWNTAVSLRICVTPVTPAVVVPTDVVLGALSVVVTVALFVGAAVATCAELPIQIRSTSRSCIKNTKLTSLLISFNLTMTI